MHGRRELALRSLRPLVAILIVADPYKINPDWRFSVP